MVSPGRVSFVKMSRITVRSREVLILLFLFAVTTLHHRCSVADVAWDRSVSVGRVMTILELWHVGQTAPTFISHVSLRREGARGKRSCQWMEWRGTVPSMTLNCSRGSTGHKQERDGEIFMKFIAKNTPVHPYSGRMKDTSSLLAHY